MTDYPQPGVLTTLVVLIPSVASYIPLWAGFVGKNLTQTDFFPAAL